MPFSFSRRVFSDYRLLLLIMLGGISYFVNLGGAPIYILDEAKNAQCAREMLQRNDWIVPTFNQQLRSDKPPLHYFAMAVAYYNWGISPFTARLFSAVCGLLTLIITYLFTTKYAGRTTAFLSGLILLASWHFTFEMRLAVPDPYLILLTTAALFSFFNFYSSGFRQQWYAVSMYILLGLGMLSKGPVAVILPIAAILGFLLIQRQFNLATIKRLNLWYGIPLILLVCLPWYALVHEHTQGAWTKEFFMKNNISRYSRIREKHGGFFLLSLIYVLAGMMPVTFFIVPLVRYIKSSFRSSMVIQFSAIVTCCILVFFTISRTQLPNYPMPCYPFISIMASFYLNHFIRRQSSVQVSLWIVFGISILIPTGIYIITRTERHLMAFPNLWIAFLIMPLGSIIALWIYRHKDTAQHHIYAMSTVLFTFIAIAWILNLYAYPEIYKSNPVTNSLRMQQINEPLVAYHIYNPAFNFYLKQPVKRIEDFNELREYLQNHPGSQVITRSSNLKQLGALHLKLYFMGNDVFENHTTCLLKQY